jgi:hypothetical protein
MRIDGSNLLVAAQAQPRAATNPSGNAGQTRFEAVDFRKPPAVQGETLATPAPMSRPGALLDIKI